MEFEISAALRTRRLDQRQTEGELQKPEIWHPMARRPNIGSQFAEFGVMFGRGLPKRVPASEGPSDGNLPPSVQSLECLINFVLRAAKIS